MRWRPKTREKVFTKTHLGNDSNKNIEIFHISIIISNNPSLRGKQGFCRNSSAVNTTCYSSKVSRLYFTYLLDCLQLSVTSDPRGSKPYSGLWYFRHVLHRHTFIQNIYIYAIKINTI